MDLPSQPLGSAWCGCTITDVWVAPYQGANTGTQLLTHEGGHRKGFSKSYVPVLQLYYKLFKLSEVVHDTIT